MGRIVDVCFRKKKKRNALLACNSSHLDDLISNHEITVKVQQSRRRVRLRM